MDQPMDVSVLHRLSRVLQWLRLGAGLAALYFLGTLLFMDGRWPPLAWAVVMGLIAWWLLQLVEEYKVRSAAESAVESARTGE